MKPRAGSVLIGYGWVPSGSSELCAAKVNLDPTLAPITFEGATENEK
jgi:hypothetical protein